MYIGCMEVDMKTEAAGADRQCLMQHSSRSKLSKGGWKRCVLQHGHAGQHRNNYGNWPPNEGRAREERVPCRCNRRDGDANCEVHRP